MRNANVSDEDSILIAADTLLDKYSSDVAIERAAVMTRCDQGDLPMAKRHEC